MNSVDTSKGGAPYRTQTTRLVATVATLSGKPRYEVWQRIYARLDTTFGLDIHTYPRNRGESLLSVAEKNDLIDKVYSLAFAEHLYLQLENEE